jgi:ABC-type Fe3+ transport system permease subunit
MFFTTLSTWLFNTLNNHIINQKQYTILVTVVILSAVLPTLIAQKYFQPKDSTMNAWDRLRKKNGAKKLLENGKAKRPVIGVK